MPGVQPGRPGYAALMPESSHLPSLVDAVTRLRPDTDDAVACTSSWAHALLDAGLLDLPLPGRGATAARFAALVRIGSVDLDLARLVEAHTDALAILSDLGADPEAGVGERARELWGVWAANPPADPLVFWVPFAFHAYCLGAGLLSLALLRPPVLLLVSLAMMALALVLHRGAYLPWFRRPAVV